MSYSGFTKNMLILNHRIAYGWYIPVIFVLRYYDKPFARANGG